MHTISARPKSRLDALYRGWRRFKAAAGLKLRPASEGIPNISLPTYVVCAAIIIIATVTYWVLPFDNYYGWQADDWMTYRKGLRTVFDWREAFLLRVNALQPYFFFYTYLPIALHLQLPSLPFPIYGPDTGNFRFIALMTVFYHGFFLAVWAWFAPRISPNRLISLFSLAAIAASPALALWMPQNETRYIGLPFVLIAIGIVINEMKKPETIWSLWRFYIAGFLVYFAFSLHYTAIYLALPLLVAIGFASLLTRRHFHERRDRVYWPWWRRPQVSRGDRSWFQHVLLCAKIYWRRMSMASMPRRIAVWLAFLFGFLTFALILEFLSSRVIGLPFSQGPLMGLIFQVDSHNVPGISNPLLGLKVRLEYLYYAWWLVGPIMLGLIMLGVVIVALRGSHVSFAERWLEWIIVATTLIGLFLVIASKGYPFFRKTLPLQPFMFLLAGAALSLFCNILTSRLAPAMRKAAFLVLFAAGSVAAMWHGFKETRIVHEAHFDMGRLVKMAAEATESGKKVYWFMPRLETYGLREIVAQAKPDDLIFTEFPFSDLDIEPATIFLLRDTTPIATAKRVWSTTALHAEHGFWIGYDLRHEPVMNDARLYRAGDLLKTLGAGKRVAVVDFSSSGDLGDQYQAQNVFDHDSMGHGTSGWRGSEVTRAHWVEFTFDQPIETDRIRMIGELFRPAPIRPDDVEISVATKPGEPLKSIHRSAGNSATGISEMVFEKQSFTRMRVTVHVSRRVSFGRIYRSVIEEIQIPGYQIETANWNRPGDKHVITAAKIFDAPDPYSIHNYSNLIYLVDPEQGRRLNVVVKPNPRTVDEVIYLDGEPVPTRYERTTQSLLALVPDHMKGDVGFRRLCSAEIRVGGRLKQRLSDPVRLYEINPKACGGVWISPEEKT